MMDEQLWRSDQVDMGDLRDWWHQTCAKTLQYFQKKSHLVSLKALFGFLHNKLLTSSHPGAFDFLMSVI